jgi:hypothetical protein
MKFNDYIIRNLFSLLIFLTFSSFISCHSNHGKVHKYHTHFDTHINHFIDPVKDFAPINHKKCNHQKHSHQKHFLAGKYDRKLANTYYNDIQFQNLRMHFDYTYTLPHEETMIKELIMPPVKRFFENSLSVRRFPGKVRFPKSVKECQGIPVPDHLKSEGVDTDLIIIVSTYRGMKKFFFEKIFGKGNQTSWDQFNNNNRKGFNSYLEKYFSEKSEKSENFEKNEKNEIFEKNNFFKNSTKNSTNNIPPWEINDGPSDVVGWSFMCIQDIYTLRPLAGVMQYVADIQPTQRNIEEAIWTTLHEITHVLAFDSDLFSDFINSEFNKLGVENVIKMKTRLKDLDKLIEERKDKMNDYLEFANFNSSYDYTKGKGLNINNNNNNNNDTKGNISDSFYINGNVKEDDKIAFKNKKLLRKNNITIENHNSSNNSNVNIFNSSINNKDRKNIKQNVINPNFNSNFNTKNISNSNKTTSFIHSHNHPHIYPNEISQNKTENNTENNIIPFSEILNILNTSKISPPVIKLPLTESFYEIKVPKNLNLTTLSLYIENFIDHTKLFLKTPKVVQTARKHFSCDSLDAVELEHFGGLGSAFSHWSKRILNTEFMIADSYGENFISNFTLALLEDSGWYKVDYSKAEVMPWGRERGCEFLEEKCIVKKQKKNSFFSLGLGKKVSSHKNLENDKNSDKNIHKNSSIIINPISNIYDSNFKEEFCTSFSEEKCSISHTFRAICGLTKSLLPIPQEYQYFEDPSIGGFVSFGDYCPYPIEWMDPKDYSPVGSCRNGIKLRSELNEKICENCRCFHSSLVDEKFFKKNSEILKKFPNNTKYHHLEDTRAACYEARCRTDPKGKVELVIIIDDMEIKCPRGGAVLSVEGYKGFVECPKAEKVCTGPLDPKGDYTTTSAYNLFNHLPEQLLSMLYDFIKGVFRN